MQENGAKSSVFYVPEEIEQLTLNFALHFDHHSVVIVEYRDQMVTRGYVSNYVYCIVVV